MDRAAFLEQHGRIKRVSPIEQLVGPLRRPATAAGESASPLFPGHFYTTGYALPTIDPQREDQPWAALADAKQRTAKWVRKLRAGGCVALQSDAAHPYMPFVCQLAADEGEPVAARLADALGLAALDVEMRLVGDQPCVFWSAEEAALYADELPERTIAHYAQVSAWMAAALDAPMEVRLAPAAVDFPVIYGGLRPAALFAGVMTVWRWT